MKSKRSCFNGALFFSALKRFWPLWIAYLICLCVLLPTQFEGAAEQMEWNRMLADGRIITERWCMELVLLTAAMGVVTAMCVFGHMYSERQTSLLCSLPVRRGAVYLSDFAAGLAPMLAADIVTVAVCAAVEASLGVFNFPILLLLLAILAMLNLTFYGFAALCAVLTGSVFVLPPVFLVLEIVVFVVEVMVRSILSELVFGWWNGGSSGWLSPLVWLCSHAPASGPDYYGTVFEVIGGNMIALGIYAALGIVCVLIGLWLYRRRAMENAGEVVAVPVLRPVFRWCMALGCGLVCAFLFCAFRCRQSYAGPAILPMAALFAVIGALVGWFAAEMLMRKTLRVFRGKTWGGACAAAAILVAGLLCAGFGGAGYETWLPAPEEVYDVAFYCGGEYVTARDEETILLVQEAQKKLVEEKAEIGRAALSPERWNSCSLHISYSLNGGDRVTRAYTLYDPEFFPGLSEAVGAAEAVLNGPAGVASKKLASPITEDTLLSCEVYCPGDDGDNSVWISQRLGAAEAAALYAAVEKDLEAGTIDRSRIFRDDPEDVTGIYINIELRGERAQTPEGDGPAAEEVFWANYDVLSGSENTLAWLRENLDLKPAG